MPEPPAQDKVWTLSGSFLKVSSAAELLKDQLSLNSIFKSAPWCDSWWHPELCWHFISKLRCVSGVLSCLLWAALWVNVIGGCSFCTWRACGAPQTFRCWRANILRPKENSVCLLYDRCLRSECPMSLTVPLSVNSHYGFIGVHVLQPWSQEVKPVVKALHVVVQSDLP